MKSVDVTKDRLVPYAAALSLEAASSELMNLFHVGKLLDVTLLDNYYIQLGGKGLCFKDTNLLQAVSTGFAVPRLIPLFGNFNNAFTSILMLLKIKKILSAKLLKTQCISVALRAGLAGTAAFANHDVRCRELLSNEKEGRILFQVYGTDIAIWFSFSKNELCRVDSGVIDVQPTAVFTFLNLKVARNAISGWFDHLGGPALGEAKISGNLPLLDKIGYISRIAQKAIPSII